MLNVFNSFIDFFSMIGNFISNLVTGLASMLGLLAPAFEAVTYSIGYMPSMLVAFATVGVSICIVFHIIGR